MARRQTTHYKNVSVATCQNLNLEGNFMISATITISYHHTTPRAMMVMTDMMTDVIDGRLDFEYPKATLATIFQN